MQSIWWYLIAKIIWAKSSSTIVLMHTMLYVDIYHCRQFQWDLYNIPTEILAVFRYSKIFLHRDGRNEGCTFFRAMLSLLLCYNLSTRCNISAWLVRGICHRHTRCSSAAPQLGSGPHPVTNLRVLSPSCQIQKWIVRDEIKTEPPRHFCRGQDRKWICCWWGTNEGGCSSQSGILKGAPDVELRSY